MKLSIIAAGGAILLSLGLSTAQAAPGYVTGNVNLRAGPGTEYPVVTTLIAGEGVNIQGCLSGYSWCDVIWRGNHGWVSSNYLQASYQSRRVRLVEAPPPVVSFSFGPYWDNHYRGRGFYRDRDRYNRRDARRDNRIERRDDRRDARIERNDDRRDARIERRDDRRDARNDRREDRRDCPPGRDCR